VRAAAACAIAATRCAASFARPRRRCGARAA
jgi:hypothetical protein